MNLRLTSLSLRSHHYLLAYNQVTENVWEKIALGISGPMLAGVESVRIAIFRGYHD